MTDAKRVYEYMGEEFEVTRTSPDSVTVGLECEEDHGHEDYIVGKIEGHEGWGVGRKTSGGHSHDGDTFLEAVQYCAAMLSEECDTLNAVEEVDEFFEVEVKPTLSERLNALAEFLPEFESPDFEFGHMEAPPGKMPHYALSDIASNFVGACYDMGWVQPFDWADWKDSPEAIQLRDDPASLESANPEQLERLLTVLIRQDRFVEGALGSAFDSGLLVRILRRVTVLVSESSSE